MKKATTKFDKITDENFNQIINGEDFVLVLFTTEDCGYCQIAKNNLNQIMNQLEQISYYLCAVDDAPNTVRELGISSAPTIKFFKDGEVVYTGFGVRTSTDLYYQLKSFLPGETEYEWPEN